MKKTHWVPVLTIFLTVGCASMMVSEDNPGPTMEESSRKRVDADIAPRLVTLLDERKLNRRFTPRDFQQTSLKDIIALTTPAGFALKVRLLNPGVPVAQALSLAKHPQLRVRLLEAARWVSSPNVRSQALVGLAAKKNPEDLKYFREALLDQSKDIQFAALEALQVWGRPEAIPMVMAVANQGWSQVVRAYASKAALQMGDPQGRDNLKKMLNDRDWVARAMAARYLGELGEGEDAELVISKIGPERSNRFVLAELCIAGIKLTAKKGPEPPPPPPVSISRAKREKRKRAVFELEPLVITAPRLKLAPYQRVDVRIDADLVRLLKELAEGPPPEQILVPDELAGFHTPTGFYLSYRYTDLSFLLVEGLAGTRDLSLIRTLEDFAKDNPNDRIRAAALVALGFDKDRADISLFQRALNDPDIRVRFGAVEALVSLSDKHQVRSTLAEVANSDSSKALRLFAAHGMVLAGDSYGRDVLFGYLNDPDWVVRALAVYYLGEVGHPTDYDNILFRLNNETDSSVIAEASLALLKLSL